MNAQEMAAVQGKALLDLAFDGRYLHWFDPVRGGPVASFDTVLPAVQRSPALINGGYAGPVAPHNEHNIVNLLI